MVLGSHQYKEGELVLHAQRGNLSAFNNLVLAYQDMVFRQACWLLKDEEEAADATQETFLLAYHKVRSFRSGNFHC